MNLYRINLNLLVALDVLLTEQNVTHAAEKLSISQAAMSNNLQQLRDILKDDLLIRKKNKMLLTNYAKTLRPRLRNILAELKNIIDRDSHFDLTTCNRTFKIGIPDHWSSLILPKLIPLIRQKAPHISINIIPCTQIYSAEPFEIGAYDIAIARATETTIPTAIQSQLLLKDEGICILNRNHPLAKKKKITLTDYLSYQHIACRVDNPDFPSVVDQFLISKELPPRDTILHTPYIDTIFRIMEKSTDLIASAVRSKTLLIKDKHHCVIKASPIEKTYSEFHIAWHKQFENDIAHQWLRNQIIEIAKKWVCV